jgi:hypothetical protein
MLIISSNCKEFAFFCASIESRDGMLRLLVKMSRGRVWLLLLAVVCVCLILARSLLQEKEVGLDVRGVAREEIGLDRTLAISQRNRNVGDGPVNQPIDLRAGTAELARQQSESAKRRLCSTYASRIDRVERKASSVGVSLNLRMLLSRTCDGEKVSENEENWINFDDIAEEASTDPFVIAVDFAKLADDIDFLRGTISFGDRRYTGRDFSAALLAMRLVPCEFGLPCGHDSVEVGLACASSEHQCQTTVEALVTKAAKDEGIEPTYVLELRDRFAEVLRLRWARSQAHISPFDR